MKSLVNEILEEAKAKRLLEITGTPVAFLPESPPRTRAECTLE